MKAIKAKSQFQIGFNNRKPVFQKHPSSKTSKIVCIIDVNNAYTTYTSKILGQDE